MSSETATVRCVFVLTLAEFNVVLTYYDTMSIVHGMDG